MADQKLITLKQLKDLASRVKSTTESLSGEITSLADDVNNFEVTEVDEKIRQAIADADHLRYKIVDSFSDIKPEEADADKYIYLVKMTETNGENSNYEEYMVINAGEEKSVEKVGDWKVDLSNYVTNEALTTQLSGYVEQEEGKSLIDDTALAKLEGIHENATKVEHSETNGNIIIDGNETTVYTLPDTVLDENDIASDDEVGTALDTIFADSVPIGKAAVDESKADFGSFGSNTDLYDGDLTRTWVGSNCKLGGTLKYLDSAARQSHTGLWADGNFVAIALDPDAFKDKTITWKFSHEKTGSVGDTDFVALVKESTQHQPIIATCNDRVIATFDLTGLTLKGADGA